MFRSNQGSSLLHVMHAMTRATADISPALSIAHSIRSISTHLISQQFNQPLHTEGSDNHRQKPATKTVSYTPTPCAIGRNRLSSSRAKASPSGVSSITTLPQMSQSCQSLRYIADLQQDSTRSTSSYGSNSPHNVQQHAGPTASSNSNNAGIQLTVAGLVKHKGCIYYSKQFRHSQYHLTAHFATVRQDSSPKRGHRLIQAVSKLLPDAAIKALPGVHALLMDNGLTEQQAEKAIRSAARQVASVGYAGFTVNNLSKLIAFLQQHQVNIPAAITRNAVVLLRKWKPQNAARVVAVLEGKLGASAVDIAIILKSTQVLYAPVGTVDAALTCLNEKLKCSWDDVRHIAKNRPLNLVLLPDTIMCKINWLLQSGFTPKQALRLCKHISVLTSSLDDVLRPNFECLLAYTSSIFPDSQSAQKWVCKLVNIQPRLLTKKHDSQHWHARTAFWKQCFQQIYGHAPMALATVLASRLAERTAPRFALLYTAGKQLPSDITQLLFPSDKTYIQALLHSMQTNTQLRCERLSNNPQGASSLLKQALSHPPYAATLQTLLHHPAATAQLHAALQSDSLDPAQVMPLFIQVYLATPEGQKWLRLERGEGEQDKDVAGDAVVTAYAGRRAVQVSL